MPNDYPPWFEVDDETREMVRYPVNPVIESSYILNWEILETFFHNHDIVPVWTNCHSTWGWYDEESGKWTGAVGKVRSSKDQLLLILYERHSYTTFDEDHHSVTLS